MCSEIIPLAASAKACSGKCKAGGCAQPRIWVIAACEGMISLLQKQQNTLIPSAQSLSLPTLQSNLQQAHEAQRIHQLILVGSRGDIAWLHASIPGDIARYISAELTYPLIPGWFHKENNPQLIQALQNAFGG